MSKKEMADKREELFKRLENEEYRLPTLEELQVLLTKRKENKSSNNKWNRMTFATITAFVAFAASFVVLLVAFKHKSPWAHGAKLAYDLTALASSVTLLVHGFGEYIRDTNYATSPEEMEHKMATENSLIQLLQTISLRADIPPVFFVDYSERMIVESEICTQKMNHVSLAAALVCGIIGLASVFSTLNAALVARLHATPAILLALWSVIHQNKRLLKKREFLLRASYVLKKAAKPSHTRAVSDIDILTTEHQL
ncbi:MAG TPA: hypothetical protein VNW54_01885 [Granulicella sp.]|nr:hypothetical protein [Granulicella sp.]